MNRQAFQASATVPIWKHETAEEEGIRKQEKKEGRNEGGEREWLMAALREREREGEREREVEEGRNPAEIKLLDPTIEGALLFSPSLL